MGFRSHSNTTAFKFGRARNDVLDDRPRVGEHAGRVVVLHPREAVGRALAAAGDVQLDHALERDSRRGRSSGA